MRLEGYVKKSWGSEQIWVTNDNYCSKFLNFNTGATSSMHFHKEKKETWYIMSGKFIIRCIDTRNAAVQTYEYTEGDTLTINPMTPHQVTCTSKGTILEVSTPDSVEDNYRIAPGNN
jgi:mannose-6-phosphate isomerase-like protein (cupin superfamily)